MAELRLISEPDREPTTESSFDDGAEAVSDEDVEGEATCIEFRTPPFTTPFGADVVLVSCRRCGGDWKAYGCVDAAEPPRYDALLEPLYMLLGV